MTRLAELSDARGETSKAAAIRGRACFSFGGVRTRSYSPSLPRRWAGYAAESRESRRLTVLPGPARLDYLLYTNTPGKPVHSGSLSVRRVPEIDTSATVPVSSIALPDRVHVPVNSLLWRSSRP